MESKFRQYQCPTCKNKQKLETNHIGEIYTGCKMCGAPTMWCIEPEAIAGRDTLHQTKVKLIHYRYDISNEDDAHEWDKLQEKLGLTENILTKSSIPHRTLQRLKDIKEVTIFLDGELDNQWITDHGRLYDWMECTVPNHSVKMGYYLEMNNEMLLYRLISQGVK